MQYIKDGFVSGANITGQFTDMLKEYPAYFKEAGGTEVLKTGILTGSTEYVRDGGGNCGAVVANLIQLCTDLLHSLKGARR